MATTEEMNRVLEDYIDISLQVGATWCNETANLIVDREIDISKDWNWIMHIWDKLRCELEAIKSMEVQVRKNNIAINLYNANITEAHRLIYEAIVWLNQNKEK